ncbi:hypothetical protein OAN96_00365 [Candidatus Gracilibacteria bacterium]|nr:hypothetical protein [Candidatus Gracilibacteria bacterium]
MNIIKTPLQVLASLWIIYIFGGSLPYKFTGHEHTQFIFGTIGDWMSGFLGQAIGNGFGDYGAYVIGAGELIISLTLLAAIIMVIMKKPSGHLFGFGGLGAMLLMIGAAFFHLATPLGIEVNGDGGSLFRAAVSIIILGGSMAFVNCKAIKSKICK